MNRPGDRLRALAARVCDVETTARVLDPAVADLQVEYGEAIRRGRPWQARWIHLAGDVAAVKAVAVSEGDRTARELRTKLEKPGAARSLGVAVALTLAATLLLELPPLRAKHGPDPTRWIWFVYLLPQALSISAPIGVALCVLGALKNSSISRRLMVATFAIATVCSGAAFINAAWIVPAANQKFRVSLAGAAVPRSASELSLGELQALLEPGAKVHARLAIPAGPRLARIYYVRWALAFAPLALSMLALSLSARLRANATIAMVSVCGLYFGYYFVTPALKPYLSPLAFGWLPNIVVTLATIIVAALPARGRSLLPAP